jgi:acyl-CoA synthetase (AMP-forming)/AMP-acid ligase II
VTAKLRTLPEALDEAAGSDGGYTFIGEGRARARSYAEMHQTAHAVAGGLLAAGLERGDVVALVINDAEDFLTTLLGAAIAGVVPASLYPPSTTAEIAPSSRRMRSPAASRRSCPPTRISRRFCRASRSRRRRPPAAGRLRSMTSR